MRVGMASLIQRGRPWCEEIRPAYTFRRSGQEALGHLGVTSLYYAILCGCEPQFSQPQGRSVALPIRILGEK